MKQALAHAAINLDTAAARKKAAEYLKAVRERHDAEDMAILRGYRALAKGHQVIDLPHVIGLGGEHDNGLPRLAIATSDQQFVYCQRDHDGRVTFYPRSRWEMDGRIRRNIYRCGIALPARDRLDWSTTNGNMRAMVPPVPPALRPVHKLSGYATLFEVEQWETAPRPPGDPALLKHIGGDLYAVLAVWDLTPLEQSVLMGRIRKP